MVLFTLTVSYSITRLSFLTYCDAGHSIEHSVRRQVLTTSTSNRVFFFRPFSHNFFFAIMFTFVYPIIFTLMQISFLQISFGVHFSLPHNALPHADPLY